MGNSPADTACPRQPDGSEPYQRFTFQLPNQCNYTVKIYKPMQGVPWRRQLALPDHMGSSQSFDW
jgi:hypothetical protein